MIRKTLLLLLIVVMTSVSGQRGKRNWTEDVRFSVDPHVKVMKSLGDNFLNKAFDYFYGVGFGLNTTLYKNFGLGVEYTYFLANLKRPELSGYLGSPSMNNFDWYILHKNKISEDFFVEEILGYSTYRMKSPYLDNSAKFSEGNSGINVGGKAVYVLDGQGFQNVVLGCKLNFYNSKIRNQNPDLEKFYAKATLLNISIAYRYSF